VLLSLVGGILYEPTNHDAHTYRLPRMLHWLSAASWHWIHAGNDRMNFSGTSAEWMSLPLVLFTSSDRALWLLNFINYLLLPGLVFGTFRAFGMGGRVAWVWMWLLPAAFCFVTQAASIGNDALGATFALSAIYFGLRARHGDRAGIVLCIFSSALLSGVKASNIPLLLPAALAVWPALWLCRRDAVKIILMALVALPASFAPVAILNRHYDGHWAGASDNRQKLSLDSPAAGIIGNGVLIALGLVQPPIMLGGNKIGVLLGDALGPEMTRWLAEEFPRFKPGLGELPTEEGAGLGLGITLAFALAVFLQIFAPGGRSHRRTVAAAVLTASCVALLVFMAKLGTESAARLATPYYAPCLAGLWMLLVRRPDVVRLRLWRWCAHCAAMLALPVVLLSPARPLWPALSLLNSAAIEYPSPLIQRARDVYAAYRVRAGALLPVRDALPETASVVGLGNGGGDLETSLWWPLGSRKIIHVLPGDSPQEVRSKGIEALCVSERTLRDEWRLSPEEFADRYSGTIIARPQVVQMVRWGKDDWIVVQLPREALNE
jgi:hypothetical protein